MSMDDRMQIMNTLKSRGTTHNCPNCKKGTYCAMEAGKSFNLCWCIGVDRDTNIMVDLSESCLCKECLTNKGSTDNG